MATATPAIRPPPLTMSMILGMTSQPATTTTMITAEAMNGPRRESRSLVKARSRRPARW